MQTTTVTQKGQVTIPASIRKSLGIKPRQKVTFIKQKDKVILKPTLDFFSLRGSLKSKKPFDIKAMEKKAQELVVKEYVKKQRKTG